METWVGRFLDGRKATKRFGMRLMPCRVTASRKCQCDCQQGATVAFTCVSKQLQHSQFFFCSLLGLSFSPGLYGFIQSDSLGTCYLTLRALSALMPLPFRCPFLIFSFFILVPSVRVFIWRFAAFIFIEIYDFWHKIYVILHYGCVFLCVCQCVGL